MVSVREELFFVSFLWSRVQGDGRGGERIVCAYLGTRTCQDWDRSRGSERDGTFLMGEVGKAGCSGLGFLFMCVEKWSLK